MDTPNSSPNSKWYSTNWLVYLLCIVFFPVGLYGLWKNESISKGLKIGITIIIGLIVIASIADPNKETTSKVAESKTPQKEQETESSEWTYSNSEDKMNSATNYFANCTSTTELDFKFPYNGGSRIVIIVRKLGASSKNEVILKVTKGQFMTSVMSSEKVVAKFDDSQPESYTYNSASDGSPDNIFLEDSDRFIKNLQKSKKLLLRITFFDEGYKDVEFNTAGLDWK